MGEEKEVAILRGLLLSLGEFDERGLPPKDLMALLPKVQEMYRTVADPGLHAASEWLLRTWKQEAWLRQVNEAWAKEKREGRIRYAHAEGREKTPQWYVNGQGQTMVVIPGPVTFVMGSPKSEVGGLELERQHEKRVGRTFALAAKSVTVEQYRQFDKGYELPEKYTRMPELPVGGINWYMAAAYCNWLSENEGIEEGQWCFEIKGEETKLKANYLSLTGYRLPTEAEMEYATRAGASTSRFFGETDELLTKYAWYQKNSAEKTWPVGSLKPNDLGLFDVQGNVSTWCQEQITEFPTGMGAGIVDDKEDGLVVANTDSRVLRGGSFLNRPSLVRSALRSSILPTYRLISYGFRPARTHTPKTHF